MSLSRRLREGWKKASRYRVYYLMITPYLIGFIAFQLYPIAEAFRLSLYSFAGGRGGGFFSQPVYVGLRNFERMFNDPVFIISLRNTVIYTIGFVCMATAVALIMALVLWENLKGTTFFRTAYFLPYATSSVIVSIVWKNMLQPMGVANFILNQLGLPSLPWLTNGDFALFAVMIVSVWQTFGYYAVILLAGLQAMPKDFYEAAKVDGAGTFATLRYITLPLLKPMLFVVIFLATISGFQVYDQIYGLTGGGPGYATMTLTYYLYWKGFENFELGLADAVGIFVFFVSLGLALIQRKALEAGKSYV